MQHKKVYSNRKKNTRFNNFLMQYNTPEAKNS